MKREPITAEMIAKGAADAAEAAAAESAMKSRLLALALGAPLEQLPRTRPPPEGHNSAHVGMHAAGDFPPVDDLMKGLNSLASYLAHRGVQPDFIYIVRSGGSFFVVCEFPSPQRV